MSAFLLGIPVGIAIFYLGYWSGRRAEKIDRALSTLKEHEPYSVGYARTMQEMEEQWKEHRKEPL